ncbi:unnamed protein product, partial [Mesorhabditis belari]|uniref:Uncharacterized protein n=1 Tax=Mesorhabditis belari TaxID=2138241 RepID=A0AAF3F0D2_9BILA
MNCRRAQVERAKDVEEAKQANLENHLHKVEREDARFQSVRDKSEQLCADLEFNIDLLKRKRISVDALVLDLAQTREYHGVFVNQLRSDLKRQKNELETWDKRSLDNKKTVGSPWSKARLAENPPAKAAIAVLISRWSSAHCDVVASLSQAPALIVQPMKAQTMTLAPVLAQNNNERGRHTSESSVEMPMKSESRAPTYFARLDVVENHPHEEIQQRAKKSGLVITSQIREVLRTGRSSTNLFQKSPKTRNRWKK